MGQGGSWREGAGAHDVPLDAKDAICWLHDAETVKAASYGFLNRIIAWNTASHNFVSRQKKQDEVSKFASDWWSEKLGIKVSIPVSSYHEDYSRLYKPGARLLFTILSLPIFTNQKLLRGSVDESFAGEPPV